MKSNYEIIQDILDKVRGKSFRANEWGLRHSREWLHTAGHPADTSVAGKGQSKAVVLAFYALAELGDSVRKQGSSVAEDYILTPAFLGLAEHIQTLLNYELGGLDGGTLSRTLYAIAENEGFDLDTGRPLKDA